MAKQKSTPGPYGSQSSTLPIQSQADQPNTDGERNSNNPEQNRDTAGEHQRCADDLHEEDQSNRCSDIILRVIWGLGNVLVIVAFAFLFYKEHFKKSDAVAIGGAAISLFANISKLGVDYKRSYDNRRCIKNKLLPVVPDSEGAHDEIPHEDSKLSGLIMPCCRSLCSRCCPCPFATFEFFESAYNSVSSGWVLSSNVKAISGRIPTNASSKYFKDLTFCNKILESFDVLLAILSLLLLLFFIICACYKRCQTKCCRPVKQIRQQN